MAEVEYPKSKLSDKTFRRSPTQVLRIGEFELTESFVYTILKFFYSDLFNYPRIFREMSEKGMVDEDLWDEDFPPEFRMMADEVFGEEFTRKIDPPELWENEE